jgi:hypothetical protein
METNPLNSGLVADFIANVKTKAAGGLTLQESGELLLQGIRLAVRSAGTFSGLSGTEKKTLVMCIVTSIVDMVLTSVPLPWWLTFAKGAIRTVLIGLADGMVEYTYRQLTLEE